MEKNIRDYLPYYIGCEVEYPNTDGKLIRATLTGVSRADGVETTYKRKKNGCVGDYLSWKENGYHNSNALNLKLRLRPLDTMTEEEKMELIRVEHSEKDYPIISGIKLDETTLWFSARDERMRYSMSFSVGFKGWMPNEFKYLLSKFFDIFNLIPEGLALDATKEVNHG